jgi:hypothetical protein
MEPLPVKLENVREYVKKYEAEHPKRKAEIPSDPNSRWFKKDPETECIDQCKYALFTTAMREAKMTSPSEPMSESQKLIHARYAALQSMCTEECRSSPAV